MATPRRLAIRSAKQTQAALEAVELQAGRLDAIEKAVKELGANIAELAAMLADLAPKKPAAKK